MKFLPTLTVLALALSVSLCRADSWNERTDLRAVCLDIRTGREIWKYQPPKLKTSHVELHSRGLVLIPLHPMDKTLQPLFLNSDTGHAAATFDRSGSIPMVRSQYTTRGQAVVLENGWRMLPLDAGNKRYIRFADAGGEKEAWRIDTPGYPHEVAAWRNLVLWAYSYLSKDGILYAYRAGEREPAWTVDVNKIVTRRPRPLTSLYFHVIEDTIYLQVEEHMLAIKPESGVVLWHRNLAADLGLQFAPDFYRRGISYAGVAKDGDILVVTYENRIIALDVRRGKYLWHMMPDTFPERALPIAHEGRLYFTAGARRKMIQVANAGERNHRQQRVRPRQQASP